MRGFNLVGTIGKTMSLGDGSECEQHLAVYQSKRDRGIFKLVKTSFFTNGDKSVEIKNGDIVLVRRVLTRFNLFGSVNYISGYIRKSLAQMAQAD